ncbi:MAG: magnesium/cobalt transporter CorA [Phycisphaerae bacterium]
MKMKWKRSRRRLSARRVGEVPGTLHVDPEAPAPVVRMIAYGPDTCDEQEVTDLASLRQAVGKAPVTWVNVDGLGDAKPISTIGEVFGLHPLALEDVVNVPQRAKVEQYGETLFVVTRMALLGERLDTEQISLFLGKGFVLTFQERAGDCLDPVRDRIRKGMGRIRRAGADYLAYAILDAVVDGYFPVLEQYGERLEDLEDQIAGKPAPSMIGRIHDAKRDLLALRRAIWPQREATSALLREELDLIGETTRMYLRDCYDHVVQIIDMVETYREMTSGLLDAYQTNISNRMNEIMKVLTIIATIFIPLGFLAGIWGMNFNAEKSFWNMPLLSQPWGYRLALGLMLAIALTMLALFWRKGWLGHSSPPSASASDGDATD